MTLLLVMPQVWQQNVVRFRKYYPKTFTDMCNLRCDLDLESNNPIFLQRKLRLMMLHYQTKFDCKRTSLLEDTTEIVIF